MKHILKEYRQGAYIFVDAILSSNEASAGDIVEIHTINGSVIYKVLIEGSCTDCSQFGIHETTSNGCFTVICGGKISCPAVNTTLAFKDLDNIMENI